MRRFKLTNSRGEEYDLMSREHFFYKPTGLGASVKTETLRAGSDWIKVNTESTQKKIGGQMVFKGYYGYSEFVTFCSFDPIYFWYCPQDEWHYLECELTSIVKSELDLSRRLFCAVTFTGFGTWRGKVTYRRSASETENAKRYPVKYTYQYSGGSMGVINISNSGNVPAPVKLRIFGPCDDPRWVLSNSTGVVTSGRVFTHIAADELLVVDPNPRTMSIAVCSAVDLTTIREIYDCSDFSTGRFLFAPSGNSIISVSQAGSGALHAEAEVESLADSV